MNWAIKLIKDLCARKFYGTLTIRFESGRVVTARKEETLKP